MDRNESSDNKLDSPNLEEPSGSTIITEEEEELFDAFGFAQSSNCPREQIDLFVNAVRNFSCSLYNYSYQDGVLNAQRIVKDYADLIENVGKNDATVITQRSALQCMLIDLAIYRNQSDETIEKLYFDLFATAPTGCFDLVITEAIVIAQRCLRNKKHEWAKRYYRGVLLLKQKLQKSFSAVDSLIQNELDKIKAAEEKN